MGRKRQIESPVKSIIVFDQDRNSDELKGSLVGSFLKPGEVAGAHLLFHGFRLEFFGDESDQRRSCEEALKTARVAILHCDDEFWRGSIACSPADSIRIRTSSQGKHEPSVLVKGEVTRLYMRTPHTDRSVNTRFWRRNFDFIFSGSFPNDDQNFPDLNEIFNICGAHDDPEILTSLGLLCQGYLALSVPGNGSTPPKTALKGIGLDEILLSRLGEHRKDFDRQREYQKANRKAWWLEPFGETEEDARGILKGTLLRLHADGGGVETDASAFLKSLVTPECPFDIDGDFIAGVFSVLVKLMKNQRGCSAE